MDALEMKAREMIETYREKSGWQIPTGEIAVLSVFKAMWMSAMPAEQVVAIAEAMHRQKFTTIEACLTRMVRAKLLRSRVVSGGVRLYEVAL